MEAAEAGLKERAIKHFEAKASLYAERYVVQASGDVLSLATVPFYRWSMK